MGVAMVCHASKSACVSGRLAALPLAWVLALLDPLSATADKLKDSVKQNSTVTNNAHELSQRANNNFMQMLRSG